MRRNWYTCITSLWKKRLRLLKGIPKYIKSMIICRLFDSSCYPMLVIQNICFYWPASRIFLFCLAVHYGMFAWIFLSTSVWNNEKIPTRNRNQFTRCYHHNYLNSVAYNMPVCLYYRFGLRNHWNRNINFNIFYFKLRTDSFVHAMPLRPNSQRLVEYFRPDDNSVCSELSQIWSSKLCCCDSELVNCSSYNIPSPQVRGILTKKN